MNLLETQRYFTIQDIYSTSTVYSVKNLITNYKWLIISVFVLKKTTDLDDLVDT